MKFSIRDLFLVTVIVALAVGWWVDHQRQNLESKRILASQRQTEESLGIAIKLIEDLGYTVKLPNYSSPAPISPKK